LDRDSSGSALIVAAIILGVALIGGSFVIKSSIDQGTQELRAAFTGLQQSVAKVAEAAPAGPAAARPSRPDRPDPNKKYNVAVGNAPTKGPKDAAVKIVEWSDFQ